MSTPPRLFEEENLIEDDSDDPDKTPIRDRRLITQPYDIVIESLIDQIKSDTIRLRPLSERPRFQRRYVWNNQLASRLIESILLNVPIPPCYLSQDSEFNLDVIDGQQRIFSIYRFLNNQFPLSDLEILNEYHKLRFHQLPNREQRKIETHTLRCIIITNDSHDEIKFDVFERLNTNTIPLNAQELRNCVYRGDLNDILGTLSVYKPWLNILGRKEPDKRLRDEELILRFFAFYMTGIDGYRTPQKHWLNSVAKNGRKLGKDRINELTSLWTSTIDKCLLVFDSSECFRRLPVEGRVVINRAIMDLTMNSLIGFSSDELRAKRDIFRRRCETIMADAEFNDLISRAVDHKSRTLRRFELWQEKVINGL